MFPAQDRGGQAAGGDRVGGAALADGFRQREGVPLLRRLVIRPGGIGDCILALPAIESLRTDYLEVWAPAACVPLIRSADAVFAIAATGLDLLGLPDVSPPVTLSERLASFDYIVSWYGAAREEFRKCVGRLGLPFRFCSALPDEREAIHAADFFLAQVRDLRVNRVLSTPRIIWREPDDAPKEAFAVIHPFSGSPRKNWSLERFQEVADWLRRFMPVYWCAGPQEALAEAHRFDDLLDLARWLHRACLYIGNDSGITHLAAAVGTPVIALFGPTDPRVWAPRGERVRVVATTYPGRAISEISCAEVVGAAESLLKAADQAGGGIEIPRR